MRKTANPRSRGHRDSQAGLSDTRDPHIVIEENKSKMPRIGGERKANQGELSIRCLFLPNSQVRTYLGLG